MYLQLQIFNMKTDSNYIRHPLNNNHSIVIKKQFSHEDWNLSNQNKEILAPFILISYKFQSLIICVYNKKFVGCTDWLADRKYLGKFQKFLPIAANENIRRSLHDKWNNHRKYDTSLISLIDICLYLKVAEEGRKNRVQI